MITFPEDSAGKAGAVVVSADGNSFYVPVVESGVDSTGKETLTVGSTAIGFSTIPAGSTKAVITTETEQIRYWVDGSTPTITQGHLANAGDAINLDSSGQLNGFKAIAVTGSATLQISYF